MSDFKPIIIEDIPLKIFFTHSKSFKDFYEKYNEIIKPIFKIEIDIKKLFNELYSIVGTIGFNIDLKYELIDHLKKYFDNIKDDNASDAFYKITLLNSIYMFAFNQIIFEDNVFVIYKYNEDEDRVDDYLNSDSYNEITEILDRLYNKVDRRSVSEHIINYINSFEIVSLIASKSTYDFYVNKMDLERFKNDFLNNDYIDSLIERHCFNPNEYSELVEIGKVIKEYIFKETNKTNLDFFNELTDYSNSSLSEKIIAFNELGILEYIKRNNPSCQTSINKLAEVLSYLTKEKTTSIYPLIYALDNENNNQSKNPYNSSKTVNKVKLKLANLGLETT